MVSDLVDHSDGQQLAALMFGGAPAPNNLPSRALAAFPGAALSQGYGLTETNSLAVSIGGCWSVSVSAKVLICSLCPSRRGLRH